MFFFLFFSFCFPLIFPHFSSSPRPFFNVLFIFSFLLLFCLSSVSFVLISFLLPSAFTSFYLSSFLYDSFYPSFFSSFPRSILFSFLYFSFISFVFLLPFSPFLSSFLTSIILVLQSLFSSVSSFCFSN